MNVASLGEMKVTIRVTPKLQTRVFWFLYRILDKLFRLDYKVSIT